VPTKIVGSYATDGQHGFRGSAARTTTKLPKNGAATMHTAIGTAIAVVGS